MDNPSAVAGLRLQHSFELEHSAEDCRRMIEEYVSMGGDGGLTERTMAEACGLKPCGS